MKEQKTKQGKPSRLYGTLYRLFAKFLIRVHRIRIWHAEREPEGTYLLCANHIAALDPFLIAAVLEKRQPHFMGKKELFRIPLLGGFLRSLGAYSVNRSGDIGAIRTTIDLIESGECVGIFPQGTRCAGRELRETAPIVKNGAGLICAKTKVTVLPLCIRTRGNRLRLFRRLDMIFGEPITVEQMNLPDTPGHADFARISGMIFEEICTLYEEELPDDGKAGKRK